MGRLGRNLYRRKLDNLLSRCPDEPMLTGVSAIAALQAGNRMAQTFFIDYPDEDIGSTLGSSNHIAPWTLETITNELLVTEKCNWLEPLRHDYYTNYRQIASYTIKLENAEDGLFLEKHDVHTEMHRIGQRQFPWQRGWLNGPALYRALKMYGTGEAGAYFESTAGITVPEFLRVGMWLGGALSKRDQVDRLSDLTVIGIDAKQREAALAKLAIRLEHARERAKTIRNLRLPTAYRASILRDFPVIVFGEREQRLRAPLPELISYRIISGLYLDVVGGGQKIWAHIGREFENYCVEYLNLMLSPLSIKGEFQYGQKKARYRTPDVIALKGENIVLVAECKAKRMTLEARFANNPITDAITGYSEIAKGIFQIWRFFSHGRRGLCGEYKVDPDCIGLILTVDPWLTMARNQERDVYEMAHKLADDEGDIQVQDRRRVAICLIDDVEFALQNGTPDSFMTACRELVSGEKQGWILSVAHMSKMQIPRPFPFHSRIGDMLPWWETLANGDK